MTYPREWLGFRVTIEGFHVGNGGIVEAVGVDSIFHPSGREHKAERGWLQVRIVSGLRHRTKALDVLGYEGCQIGTLDVLPLTPAARELLREVLA